MTFYIIRGISIIEGYASDEYQYMAPPSDVLDDIVGDVAVLNMSMCNGLTTQLAGSISRSHYAVSRRLECHAIRMWLG